MKPPCFVDIHCHLLPGIDDGSSSWQDTLAMARMAAADGIGVIVATPHQLGNYGQNDGEMIRQHTAKTQEFLDQHQVPLRVLPGADVRIEPDLVAMIRRGEVVTLGDHRRHILLELPHEIYLPLDGLLGQLKRAGMVGILSHPERNGGILGRPDVLAPLVEAGCLMQVTAGSLVGTFGPQIQKFAHWMVQEQLVHFVATDAHGPKSRRPLMQRAYECVVQLVGQDIAEDVCCHNPASVAAGEAVAPPKRRPKRAGLAGWFRWNKAG